MRRLKSLGLMLVAAAIGLGSLVMTPKAARAEIYIGAPSIGIYIGDGPRRHRHVRRHGPPRYVYDHYGPARYYRPAPRRYWRRHWRRNHGWRHDRRWRPRHHHHGGWRGHGRIRDYR